MPDASDAPTSAPPAGALSRRELVRASASGAALLGAGALSGEALAAPKAKAAPVALHWIDGAAPVAQDGQVFGAPWPRGALARKTSFAMETDAGPVPVQTWPLAVWPDGSLKWTAHAIPAGASPGANPLIVPGGKPAAAADRVAVATTATGWRVACGGVDWDVASSGEALIRSAVRSGRQVVGAVRLHAGRQAGFADNAARSRQTGRITGAALEQSGPVRAVIRLEGVHGGEGRDWLPFTVRLVFHAGSDRVKIMHTFIHDGDTASEALCGLGISVDTPLRAAPHDRHVRFAAPDGGLFREAARPLTGLRRDPGRAFREAQIAGRATPDVATMPPAVAERLSFVPVWQDFSLGQSNADGFELNKRTKAGHAWVKSTAGRRALGMVSLSDPQGGAALAMRHFWKRPPTRLDVRDAGADTGRIAVWLWSPDAPALDMRPYHDGLGQKTHADEIRGLDITYEDHEDGFNSPYGIARTNELTLWALDATPDADALTRFAESVETPPRLLARPEPILAANVFSAWSLVDRSTPRRARLEDQMEALVAFYASQVEERRWYGFWDHGDVMHTYDADRRQWRYDIGGFAWDNSELSPDLWLWYAFLRSGSPTIFRLAEDMTRHTGEVDVYHIGPWRGFGTRHGVQHWSDSSKQPRVSTAAYRRIYYYLTADERVGDLMRELVDSDETLTRVHIERKLAGREGVKHPEGVVEVGFGTTWGSFLAAWLTEWERTGDPRWRNRISAGMRSLAALPKRWMAGASLMDLKTGRFIGPGDRIQVSHLNAVFGAMEVNADLLALMDEPAYRAAWLEYCVWYSAPADAFEAKFGEAPRGRNLRQGHSRLTAYAARELKDAGLAARAWEEFFNAPGEPAYMPGLPASPVPEGFVLSPASEAPAVSTNWASQWGLAMIQNLALVPEALEAAADPPPIRNRPR